MFILELNNNYNGLAFYLNLFICKNYLNQPETSAALDNTTTQQDKVVDLNLSIEPQDFHH